MMDRGRGDGPKTQDEDLNNESCQVNRYRWQTVLLPFDDPIWHTEERLIWKAYEGNVHIREVSTGLFSDHKGVSFFRWLPEGYAPISDPRGAWHFVANGPPAEKPQAVFQRLLIRLPESDPVKHEVTTLVPFSTDIATEEDLSDMRAADLLRDIFRVILGRL